MLPKLPDQFQPKGLYIHVPFCASRCPYCDFFVVVSRQEELHLQFVQRLLQQLDSYLEQQPELLRQLETVFLGGGTPSLLGARILSYLLGELDSRLQAGGHGGLGQLAELSMESNPELIQLESLQLWRDLGITRLSIGLQSCSDKLLKLLGRRSSRRTQEQLAALVTRHFCGEYSFDFMYGIPGQTLDDIADSLDFVQHYQPHHVSYYELSIEDDTLFGYWQREGQKGGRWPGDPDDELSERQFELLCSGLESLGYERYEVSNFARARETPKKPQVQETPARQRLYSSRHNEIYWRWQPYLGLGPSAVGAALLAAAPGQMACIWRMEGPQDHLGAWHRYLQQPDFGVSCNWLSPQESLWEYLLMALRLRRGIDVGEFAHLFWPQQPEQAGNCAVAQQRERDKQHQRQLLRQMLPKTMSEFEEFFYWQINDGAEYLRLSERGYNLQGLFLRKAYQELGL